MTLSDKVLKIQEWANKTISRDCLMQYNYTHRTISPAAERGRLRQVFGEKTIKTTILFYDEEIEDSLGKGVVIGKPMTYGRLCYLSQINQNKNGLGAWSTTYAKMLMQGFTKYPEAIQQTVLDWSEELLDLVIEFLESLPKEGCSE